MYILCIWLCRFMYTVPSKRMGTARSGFLFLLYTEDIWIWDQNINLNQEIRMSAFISWYLHIYLGGISLNIGRQNVSVDFWIHSAATHHEPVPEAAMQVMTLPLPILNGWANVAVARSADSSFLYALVGKRLSCSNLSKINLCSRNVLVHLCTSV